MVLQALITAVFTFMLFAISEFTRGLFIGPILSIRELIGNIVDKLVYYAADLTSGATIDASRERMIREELRSLATQLRAKVQMLPAYRFWATMRLVPSVSDVEVCARNLVGLSNCFKWDAKSKPLQGYAADYEKSIVFIGHIQHALRLKSKIV